MGSNKKLILIFGILVLVGTIFSINDVNAQFLKWTGPANPTIGNTIAITTNNMICSIDNTCYGPYQLVATAGDTIDWDNHDIVIHRVTSGDPSTGPSGLFNSGDIIAGGSFSTTISQPGLYAYYDPLFPFMKGQLLMGPTIFFEEDQYGVEHAGHVLVVDEARNTSPIVYDNVNVTLESTVGAPDTINILLEETNVNSGLFKSQRIFFAPDNGNNVNDPGTINAGATLVVNDPDTVTASYVDTTSTTRTTTVNIVTSGVLPTIGSFQGTPALNCNLYGGDDPDYDALCTDWEVPNVGIQFTDQSTGTYFEFKCNNLEPGDITGDCPTPDIPDVYVEVDYMTNHEPLRETLRKVIEQFASSPNHNFINLHIQIDEEIPHKDFIKINGTATDPGFYQLKNAYFGTAAERQLGQDYINAKKQVFHYVIFVHSLQDKPLSSGYAEIPGDDFIVSLGSFDGRVGSEDQIQGTFMHELGHNLGLLHGGEDSINYKPNYLSVMNYAFQFSDFVSDRPLDYSNAILNELNEAQLNEATGLDPYTPQRWTAFGPAIPLNPNPIPPDPDLVSHWKLAGSALDSVGLNHGTFTNPDYGNGITGPDAVFNAINNYVTVTDSTSLHLDEFTAAFWVKRTVTENQYDAILMKMNHDGTKYTGGTWGFHVPDSAGETVRFIAVNDNGGFSLTSQVSLPLNAWNHIVGTFDGTTMSIYRNGTLQDTSPFIGTWTPSNTNTPLRFASNSFFVGNLFGGELDDVRLYKRALTAQEVDDLHLDTFSDTTFERVDIDNGLVSAWNFENNADDDKGQNNGIFTQPNYGNGIIQKDAIFGGNNYVTVANSASLQQLDKMSVAFWVKRTATENRWDSILMKMDRTGGVFSGGAWGFDVPDTGGQTTRFLATNDGGTLLATPSVTLPLNTWNHIVGTFDGTTMSIYLNGTLQGSSPFSGTWTTSNTNNPLRFGAHSYFVGNFFEGELDTIRLYDIPLSSVQVQALYDSQDLTAQVGLGQTGDSIDWNHDRTINTGFVAVDLNKMPGYDSPGYEILKGFDDWDNLQYNFRQVSTFDYGRYTDPDVNEEITIEHVKDHRSGQFSILYNAILNLPDYVFAQTPDSDTSRNTLLDHVIAAESHMQNNQINSVISELEQIQLKVDGYTISSGSATTFSVQSVNESDDLIIKSPAREEIYAIVTSLLNSHETTKPYCIHDVNCEPEFDLLQWFKNNWTWLLTLIIAIEVGIVMYLKREPGWWQEHWYKVLPIIIVITLAIFYYILSLD